MRRAGILFLLTLLIKAGLLDAAPRNLYSAQGKAGRVSAKSKVTPNVASNRVPDPSAHLPVRRVVLYKNGVGYFEHSATVRGNQEVNIDFTTAQLNDVLKSLTIVDTGEGKISSVRYNSLSHWRSAYALCGYRSAHSLLAASS